MNKDNYGRQVSFYLRNKAYLQSNPQPQYYKLAKHLILSRELHNV